jgi:hypothetical protein
MKYIRTFESHREVKESLKKIDSKIFNQVVNELIKESVIQVGDIYKVRVMADVPQSLLNSYVKKVKDTTGKNVRQFFGDVEVAEELVRHIVTVGLDADALDANILLGGAQGQAQSTDQVQVADAQTQVQPAAQTQVQPAAQTTEAPAAQTTEAPAAQTTEAPAAQTTEAPVAQPSAQFEEPKAQEAPATQEEEEEKEEGEKEEGEEEEELPL